MERGRGWSFFPGLEAQCWGNGGGGGGGGGGGEREKGRGWVVGWAGGEVGEDWGRIGHTITD